MIIIGFEIKRAQEISAIWSISSTVVLFLAVNSRSIEHKDLILLERYLTCVLCFQAPWGTAMVVCGIAAERENSSHGGALGEKCAARREVDDEAKRSGDLRYCLGLPPT